MGNLYLVTTPIGNLNEMSDNSIKILKEVDIIACEDTRTSSVLLNHFNIKNKLISYHKFNEQSKSNSIIDDLLNGKNIALISDAGVPSISDPGYIIVKKCIENKINVYAIGINCALINSLVVSGFDTSNFTFYGFLSRDNKTMKEQLKKMLNDKIAIIYESPKRIIKTLEKINEYFNNPNICVCNDLTKKFEKKYYGKTLDVINELTNNKNYELGEYVIVIEIISNDNIGDEENNTIEAELVNIIIKNNCNMKEAIKLLTNKYDGKFSKNEIYNASLNLKKIL